MPVSRFFLACARAGARVEEGKENTPGGAEVVRAVSRAAKVPPGAAVTVGACRAVSARRGKCPGAAGGVPLRHEITCVFFCPFYGTLLHSRNR